jgi:hypothetical protein
LLPRACLRVIHDRYLIGIIPSAIVLLLLLYERWTANALIAMSIAVLGILTLYTMAATHDFYADLRASHLAVQELLSDGVPRTAIAEGFASDLWEQLEVEGHVNNPKMFSASTNYNPHVQPRPFSGACTRFVPQDFEPVIRPQCLIGYGPNPCVASTDHAPIAYQAWLPPIHRAKLIQRSSPIRSEHTNARGHGFSIVRSALAEPPNN